MLTASSDAIALTARTLGISGMREGGRLLAFVAASATLHALTIGAYDPGTGNASATQAPVPRVLHAMLSPQGAPHAERPPQVQQHEPPAEKGEEASAPSAGAAAKPQPAPSDARGDLRIPLPDHWYGPAELDLRAEPLSLVEPAYPADLVGPDAVAAKVRVRLFIDERGIVRKLEMAARGPQPEFDEAARRAWENVRFSPAIKNGHAVKSQKLLELDFRPY